MLKTLLVDIVIAALVGILLGWFLPRLVVHTHAEQAPYQVYRISYGCLYVVTSGPAGSIAAVVTPSVSGECR